MSPLRQRWARWFAYGLDPFSNVGVAHVLVHADDDVHADLAPPS